MKSNCCNADITFEEYSVGEANVYCWSCTYCDRKCNPIQVRSDQELIIEGKKATVRPVTESLQETATKVMMEDRFQERLQQASEEYKELVEAIEYVLDHVAFTHKGEGTHYNTLLKFLRINKPRL